MRLHTLIAMVLGAASLAALASTTPRFDDYPADGTFAGHHAKVKIEGAQSRKFATMLREGARKKTNFAGHYTLASWGCGASCTMTAAIDSKTGTVAWLPFTVCCWDVDIAEPLEYRVDSRLLVIHGARNEEGNGTYYYDFDGEQFKLVKSEEK